MTAFDPWEWLLGRGPAGEPRLLVPGGHGRANPRILLLRRAVPCPRELLAELIATLAHQEGPEGLRWRHHRDRERRDWMLFSRGAQEDGETRYIVGIEWIDRTRLGLWFFSGFREPNALEPGQLAAFEATAEGEVARRLPRFELDEESPVPWRRWIAEAFEDACLFDQDAARAVSVAASAGESGGSASDGVSCDRSQLVTAALAAASDVEAPEPAPARLILCDRSGPRLVELGHGHSRIGRDPSGEVVLEAPTVSAHHADLEITAGGARISDEGSRNGLLVNGRRLAPGATRELTGPAVLQLGELEIYFDGRSGDPTDDERRRSQALARLDARMPDAVTTEVELEAAAAGLTPIEQLVLDELLTPTEAARISLGGEGFPRSPWPILLTLGVLLPPAVALWSWWTFLRPPGP